MNKINILITGISSSNSITFIKGLRKQTDIQFIISGTDVYEECYSPGASFCDNFYKIPYASENSFVLVLLKICKENSIDVLVPIIDEEFLPISKFRDDFEKLNTKVMLPKHEVLSICRNKVKTYDFLKHIGVPVPDIYLSISDINNFPVIKKPVIGRGSKGINIILNKKKLKVSGNNKEYFYQKYVEGTEFTVDTLSDLNGNVLKVVSRVRLEVKDGKSIKGQIVKNKDIEDTVSKICTKLGLTGPACVQCILNSDNIPYFFDINPRIGSATILTIQAGMNIPFLAVKNILGLKVDMSLNKINENTIMLRYWNEVFTSVEE